MNCSDMLSELEDIRIDRCNAAFQETVAQMVSDTGIPLEEFTLGDFRDLIRDARRDFYNRATK